MDIWFAFTFLAIMNNAAVYICVQIFVWTCVSFLLALYLGVKLLSHGNSSLTS